MRVPFRSLKPHSVRPRRLFVFSPLLACLLYTTANAKSVHAEEGAPEISPEESNVEFNKIIQTAFRGEWSISPATFQTSRDIAPKKISEWNLRHCSTLSVTAVREKAGPGVIRLRWVLRSRLGGMYAASQATVVPTGVASVVAVSLNPDTCELVPAGHQRPWDALAAGEVVNIELRAECNFPAAARDDVKIVLSKVCADLLRPAAAAHREIIDLALAPAGESSRAAALLSFRINPPPADPYASEGEGDVRVKLPDGREALAFLDEQYFTRDDGNAVLHFASGRPLWRAFLPALPANGSIEITSGASRWQVAVRSIGAAPAAGGTFEPRGQAGDPSPSKGVLCADCERWRVPIEVLLSKNPDPCMAALPLAQLGADGAWKALLRTDFEKIENYSSDNSRAWRPVPFWDALWGNFGGDKRPNSVLALQIDELLAQAAAQKRTQPLVILDGEMFENAGTFNWLTHPLKNFIAGPGELYRSAKGVEFCHRWARYCIARWGMSKAVSSLVMTPQLNAPGVPEFFDKFAPVLRRWSKDVALPVVAFHPLARMPETVKASSFEHNVNWRVDQRLGGAYGHPVSDAATAGPAYEIISSTERGTSVALVNAFNTMNIDWKTIPGDNFAQADALLFDVSVPAGSPPDLQVGVHLRDRDTLWYEAMAYGLANPGDWRTFAVDLTGRNSSALKALGHNKPWNDYSRQRLTEIGLHVYSTHPGFRAKDGSVQSLAARFFNIRAVKFQRNDAAPKPQIALLNPLPAAPVRLFRGDLWECNFTISKTFLNPFDAVECDLAALITTPSGKEIRVPAFFNQPCRRREETPGGNEVVEPDGAEYFTVRYRAVEAGAHRVSFELREGGKFEVVEKKWQNDQRFTPDGRGQQATRGGWGGGGYPAYYDNGRRRVERVRFVPGPVTASLKPEGAAFVVADKSDPAKRPFHGFLRVAADKRHFEFDDGTFFYPLGPCLRSPSDTRTPYRDPKWNYAQIDHYAKRGTYQYDEYFAQFEKAGMNWARVWMSPWWCGLEWRRDWPGFQGIGRYNMANAWRLDHLLADAEAKGIVIDLCLTNHGQYSLRIDAEWMNNPFNSALGGPLVAASEFFTRADAKIAHQNKLRYVVARYGHSPAVMAWSLFSELEWTEEYEPSLHWNEDVKDDPVPNIDSWHSEMAHFLKEIDPNRHLVTTHYSHPSRGESTLLLPEIEYATSNAYSAFDEWGQYRYDASYALAAFWAGVNTTLTGFKHFEKPALVEEQGRHWAGGAQNTKVELEADLHAGLWGSVVQPLGGATGYWWWLQLHYDDRYGDYKAIAKFMEGEDMRPARGEALLEPVFRSKLEGLDEDFRGRALKSNKRMYAWIYHYLLPYGKKTPSDSENNTLKAGGFEPGAYSVEFWDTRTGRLISSADAVVKLEDGKASSISVPMPPIKGGDIAIKVKPK